VSHVSSVDSERRSSRRAQRNTEREREEERLDARATAVRGKSVRLDAPVLFLPRFAVCGEKGIQFCFSFGGGDRIHARVNITSNARDKQRCTCTT